MKIVVDSNRVLAALIKDSTTRQIILDRFFQLVAPDYILTEIRKYEDRVLEAASITKDDFEILLALIFEHITIVPEIEYSGFLEPLKYDIPDPKDLVYIAVCLGTGAEGIWTHDPHFNKQNKVKVLTNIDMLRASGKAKPE